MSLKLEASLKIQLMVDLFHLKPRAHQFSLYNSFQSLAEKRIQSQTIIVRFSLSLAGFGASQSQFIRVYGRALYKALITTACLYCAGLVTTVNSCQGQII